MAQGNYENHAEIASKIVRGYSEIFTAWVENYVLPFYGQVPKNMPYLNFQSRTHAAPAPQPASELASKIIEIQISSEKIGIQA